jgi:hypothetical protein
MISRSFFVLCALLIGLSWSVGPQASAHPGPNVRRGAKACNGLLKPGKRRACRACVKRPKPHHFHPKHKKGNRCRPNNGKP